MLFAECLENVRFVADSHSKLAKSVNKTQCFICKISTCVSKNEEFFNADFKFVYRGFKYVQQKICVVFLPLTFSAGIFSTGINECEISLTFCVF
jgi:hypothetical protein